MSDARSSIRVLRRRPVFALTAVLILALGLSAGVAVFTYVNAYTQRFPGVDHGGLVRLFESDDEDAHRNPSYLDFLDYAAAADGSFAGLAAAAPYYAASVRRAQLTEVAFLEAVSGGYFSVLGIETVLGRGLTITDDHPSATPVAVLSHRWWQQGFGGDSSVLGQTIFLNFRPFTVVGVANPAFVGGASDFRPAVWIPIAPFRDRYTNWSRAAENRDVPLVRVYGRLRDGRDAATAHAELVTLAAGLDAAHPTRDEPRRLRLDPATWIDPRTRESEEATIRLMLGAAGGLLLLVCANVANLLLALASGRRRELALRAAIGASPRRLASQILVENVMLSAVAGAVALLLANPASARLGSYFARPSVWGANISRATSVDLRVVGFAVAAAVVTGLVAGLLPALQASRRDLVDTLKSEAAFTPRGPRMLFGGRLPPVPDLLVSLQVALAVVLLVTAGLVVRTLTTVLDRDPGFRPEQFVAAQISTSSTEVPVEDRERFLRQMTARMSEEPWIASAASTGWAVLAPHPSVEVQLEGHDDPVTLPYTTVMPGFFETLGVDILQGRGVALGDSMPAPGVAVVNQTLAARYFPSGDAIGRTIRWPRDDGSTRAFEIVGVAPDVMERDFLVDPEPIVYFSYAQQTYGSSSALLIATSIPPAAAVPMIQEWLRAYEPHLAIINVLPYTAVISGFVYTQRMNAELFSVLAILGLILAAVGIFGVVHATVTRRTREVGVRMAIGARRRDIERLMLRRALWPVGVGLVAGLAVSLGISEIVRTLLFGVEPADPRAILGGASMIVLVSLVAAYLPSRRAAAIDPVRALRNER